MVCTSCYLITAVIVLPILYLGKKFFEGRSCNVKKDLTGKVIIVTGGNSGIGKATTKALASMRTTIIIASRDLKRSQEVVEQIKQETGNKNIHAMKLDLGKLASVKEFADSFKSKFASLDILINNSGVFTPKTIRLTEDGFESNFGVNNLGHFYLTTLLLSLLKQSPEGRIINLSPEAHRSGKMNWDDLNTSKNYSMWAAYAQSKLENELFTIELQRRFNEEGAKVSAFSLHPGAVRTEIFAPMNVYPVIMALFKVFYPILWYLTKSPEGGAQTTLHCALEDLSKLKEGGYYNNCKAIKAGKAGQNAEDARRLWEVSEKLVSSRVKLAESRIKADMAST